MKYSLDRHNETFSIPFSEEVQLTIKVRYMNKKVLYDIYSDDRLHGTIYKAQEIWRTHDPIEPMVVELIGNLIEKHRA